jgi:hypothetical protein
MEENWIGEAFICVNALVMLRKVRYSSVMVVSGGALGVDLHAEYADMLSDALFGICRICGNFPSWTTDIAQCCPVVSPKVLLESRVDPFGVLPMKSSPSVNSLMYHCQYHSSQHPSQYQFTVADA